MSSQYYSDDEYDHEEQKKEREFSKIKHFTLEDYLECPETYKIINDEWNERIEQTLEDKIYAIYEKYYNYFKDIPCDFLARSTDLHSTDLFSLVKFHLVRNYSLDLFKENPSLATPLVNSLDMIKRVRKQNKIIQMQDKFMESNQTFSWGNCKK